MPELAALAEIAKLGIGTMMAFGVLGTLWYLLKRTIPGLEKSHSEALAFVHERNIEVVKFVSAEFQRSCEAICQRMDKSEVRLERVELKVNELSEHVAKP